MMHGARQGLMTGMRRLVAGAMARDLCAFVVPGPDVARAWGLDLAAAGLHLAGSPRHANLLLIIGDLPPELSDAASVVYAQMPRPRAILALGTDARAPLPGADATGALTQSGLEAGLKDLRRIITQGAFAAEPAEFDAPILGTRIEYTCPMHPEVIRDEPGSCPICGMTLVEREASAQGHAGHGADKPAPEMDHAPQSHAAHGAHAAHTAHAAHGTDAKEPTRFTCPMHPEVISDQPGSCPKCGMHLVPVGGEDTQDHGGHGSHGDHHQHGDHTNHSGHGTDAEEPTRFTCPMHPEVISETPGSCPKCGMHLVPVGAEDTQDHGGHGDHHQHGDHTDHSAHGTDAEEPTRFTCPMHPEVISETPGSCPKCGMHLVPVGAEDTQDHGGHGDHHQHGDHTDHSAHGTDAKEPTRFTCPMHPEVITDQPGSCPKCGMHLVPVGAEDTQDHGGHGEHSAQGKDAGHGGHMHGHSGHGSHSPPQIDGIEANFMSMVDLTRDLPASPDGLKMEWITAPFGPFFPGLPGGLGLMLTLDGDSVAKAEAQSLAGSALGRDLDAHAFVERLASLVPLAPVGMRALACLALTAAAGRDGAGEAAAARAAALERERIASHLSWLAGFASQIGMTWLERRAGALQRALRHADMADVTARARDIKALLARVRAVPLLRTKLGRIGKAGRDDGTTGPVARAAGLATDTRGDDPVYGALGFSIVTQSAGDALARLNQRLDEIAQSLDLIARAGAIELPAPPDIGPASGHGMASIETPRGTATAHLTLKDGRVTEAQITTPFAAHAALIGRITAQSELADALTAIGSLDLDPWEITP